MSQKQFTITAVRPLDDYRLSISYADGFSGEVDLSDVLGKYPTLERAKFPHVFHSVKPDEWNLGVIFDGDDDLTLASDNLRAMAIEQDGGFSHQQLVAWMAHHGMSLDSASEALGVSRRMLAYYRSGEKPIPRPVGLAMLGWDVVSTHGTEHAFEYGSAA